MITPNLFEGAPSPKPDPTDLLVRLTALEQTVVLLKTQLLEGQRALLRAGAKIAALIDTVSVDRAALSGTTFEQQWDEIERSKCIYLSRQLRELRKTYPGAVVDELDDRTPAEKMIVDTDLSE